MVMTEAVDGIEKIQKAKSDGIRFVQLQFTDIIGHVKAVTIPIHQLEGSRPARHLVRRQLDRGLHPDRRERPVPHARHEHVRRDPVAEGVGPARHRPRHLRRVHARAASRSSATRAASCASRSSGRASSATSSTPGPELEFFLFRRDEDGRIAPLPHDQAGYFDFSTDLAQEVRQDMVDALGGVRDPRGGGPSRGRGRPARDRLRVLPTRCARPTTRSRSSSRSRRSRSSTACTRRSCPSPSTASTAPACTRTSACSRSPRSGTRSPTRRTPTACPMSPGRTWPASWPTPAG